MFCCCKQISIICNTINDVLWRTARDKQPLDTSQSLLLPKSRCTPWERLPCGDVHPILPSFQMPQRVSHVRIRQDMGSGSIFTMMYRHRHHVFQVLLMSRDQVTTKSGCLGMAESKRITDISGWTAPRKQLSNTSAANQVSCDVNQAPCQQSFVRPFMNIKTKKPWGVMLLQRPYSLPQCNLKTALHLAQNDSPTCCNFTSKDAQTLPSLVGLQVSRAETFTPFTLDAQWSRWRPAEGLSREGYMNH